MVDTGIHAFKWTREQAITYMADNEGLHPDDAESEIERYVTWPGQAPGYKVGMLRIQALRKMAREELGDRFDIRAFHDEILRGGGAPLQVLETRVQHWVEKNSENSGVGSSLSTAPTKTESADVTPEGPASISSAMADMRAR